MNKIMSPSNKETVGITDGQIDKAADVLRSVLRKHRSEFCDTDVTQQAVTTKQLGQDLLAAFRKHFERFNDLIIRLARPNRNQTPQEALLATGRKQYTTASIVAAMPRGEGNEAKVVFFKPDKQIYDENGLISDENLAKEYKLHGFKPVDPYSLAKANEDDPAFADNHPNATHWKDKDGNCCYAAFDRWDGERRVGVDQGGGRWDDRWWFAGLAIDP
ncbi:MAG: hypothetical protein AAB973_01440 [Patescibacteria group bacterium]